MADSIKQVQEQINALASAHEDGIDTVASGIQDLYKVIDHLTEQARNADIIIASLKYILIQKNIFTEHELDSLHTRMVNLASKKLDGQKPNEKKTVEERMQDELQVIHAAAKQAAENPYDADAFIFGK